RLVDRPRPRERRECACDIDQDLSRACGVGRGHERNAKVGFFLPVGETNPLNKRFVSLANSPRVTRLPRLPAKALLSPSGFLHFLHSCICHLLTRRTLNYACCEA